MDLTIKEYAAIERVTERTVKNWIAKGAIDVRRTPGGGVRIPAGNEGKNGETTGKTGK
jgi:excisionase family DNA binding protein